jgi:hypothetical protein
MSTVSFKKAQERLAKLPEDGPEIFELFIQWLFSKGCNLTPEPLNDLSATATDGDSKLRINTPSTNNRAWALGDESGVIGFKNYATDQIWINYTPKHPSHSAESTRLYKIGADDIVYYATKRSRTLCSSNALSPLFLWAG